MMAYTPSHKQSQTSVLSIDGLATTITPFPVTSGAAHYFTPDLSGDPSGAGQGLE